MVDSVKDSMVMSLSRPWEMVRVREAWRAAVLGSRRVGNNLATEQQPPREEICVTKSGVRGLVE